MTLCILARSYQRLAEHTASIFRVEECSVYIGPQMKVTPVCSAPQTVLLNVTTVLRRHVSASSFKGNKAM
jgi:hypothetical protein